jgi:hypothetical protein
LFKNNKGGILKNYSKQEILDLIQKTALEVHPKGIDVKIIMNGIAVMMAESGLDPFAVGVNPNGTVDLGAPQWNSRRMTMDTKINHPDDYIDPKRVFDLKYSLKRFWEIFPVHPNYWTTYRNGKFKGFLK